MVTMRILLTISITILGGAAYGGSVATGAGEPGLTDAELGHLRHFVSLARQDLDDWTGWDAMNQGGLEAFRYQIAFMTYALAFQQYHSVPAYRDLYQDTINLLIKRMIQKPVWEFWEEVSKGSADWDPDYVGGAEGTRDPVGEKNIMYSGHIVHMVALYESLYRDYRWSEKGALTFRWDSDQHFVYDMPSLVRIIHDEMMAPRLPGSRDIGAMECEPNLVFPECNQHPTLAFMLFDRAHNTSFSTEIQKALKAFFVDNGVYHPKTKHAAAYYRIKQDSVLHIPLMSSGSADGWTGAFMHGWDPAYIESLYEKQRDDYIKRDAATGAMRLSADPTPELGPGFFANLAVEIGDMETANLLFDYVDKNFGPVWEDGALHYTRQVDVKKNLVSNTSDKLIAMARSNRPNGIHKLHNQPWSGEDFTHPLLEKVDFPNVLVRQAYWDSEGETLRIALEPGAGGVASSTFRVTNLDPSRPYSVVLDGETVADIRWDDGQSGDAIRVIAPGTVELRVPIRAPVQLSLQAE